MLDTEIVLNDKAVHVELGTGKHFKAWKWIQGKKRRNTLPTEVLLLEANEIELDFQGYFVMVMFFGDAALILNVRKISLYKPKNSLIALKDSVVQTGKPRISQREEETW